MIKHYWNTKTQNSRNQRRWAFYVVPHFLTVNKYKMHPAGRKGENSRSFEIWCSFQSEEVNAWAEITFNPKTRGAHWNYFFIYNAFLMSKFQMNCLHGSPCRRPHWNSCFCKRSQFVAAAYWQMTFENMTSHGRVCVCILQDKTSLDPISPPPSGECSSFHNALTESLVAESPCWQNLKSWIKKPLKSTFSAHCSVKEPCISIPTFPFWSIYLQHALCKASEPSDTNQHHQTTGGIKQPRLPHLLSLGHLGSEVSVLVTPLKGSSETPRAQTSPALNKNTHSNRTNKKSNLLFSSEGVIRDKMIKY